MSEKIPHDHKENTAPPAGDAAADLSGKTIAEQIDAIFSDPDARRVFIGLFDLAYKIDRREHTELYEKKHD